MQYAGELREGGVGKRGRTVNFSCRINMKKEGDGLNYEGKSKDKIIKAEKRKLAGIYTRLDEKTKKSVGSLVDEAAFMAASLYELRKIIDEKGYTEEYQNGANQRGVKKCSEVEIYNTMIKNYSAIVKQLTDLLPKEQAKSVQSTGDGFEDFVNGRDD